MTNEATKKMPNMRDILKARVRKLPQITLTSVHKDSIISVSWHRDVESFYTCTPDGNKMLVGSGESQAKSRRTDEGTILLRASLNTSL